MILIGIGGGLAFNPVLMAAMSDVEPQDAGLASGITNTAFMMGGALGLAVLASVAASRTHHLTATRARRARGARRAATTSRSWSARSSRIAAAVVGAVFLRTRTAAAGAREPVTA